MTTYRTVLQLQTAHGDTLQHCTENTELVTDTHTILVLSTSQHLP